MDLSNAPSGRRRDVSPPRVKLRRGPFLKPFAGTGSGREYYIAAFQGCTFGCVYCYLRSYLDSVEPTFFANLDDLESELGDFLSSPQATGARVYLAHLGEPVPFEPFTRLAARVAPLFPGPRDAVLEIRTKSDQIEALAPAFGPGTVLSWTLTPAPFDRRYEPCAPPTESRVLALARAASRGARVAVRLDPLITRPGWEEAYAAMLAGLAKTGAPLQDVQIGVLRFTPAQRSVLESTEMGRELLADELLRGPDGKVKLHAPRRIPVLRRARDLVRAAVGPDVPISLCMEPPWVTRAVALPRTTNVSDV